MTSTSRLSATRWSDVAFRVSNSSSGLIMSVSGVRNSWLDIREEGRLSAVDLGEGFGAPALLLIGLRVRGCRRDLPSDEGNEASVALVVEPKGIEAEHEHAEPTCRAARKDREHDRLRRRLAPGLARQRSAEHSAQIAEALLMRSEHIAERPNRRAVDGHALGNRYMAGCDAADARKQQSPALRLSHIERGKGKVARIARQRLRAALASLLPGPRVRRPRGQVPQQRELAPADHALCVISVGADDAARGAVVIRNGAIGKRVVGLFRVAIALHDQELLFDIGAFEPGHRGRQHRADVVPDLLPDGFRRLPQGPRVLSADDRLVGVVVEVDQILAPPDPDRLARGEHDANGGLQTLRPIRRRAHVRARPVVGAHERAHFSSARQEVRRSGRPLRRAFQRLSLISTYAARLLVFRL